MYPDANVEIDPKGAGLILKPSRPAVPEAETRRRIVSRPF